MPLTYKEAGKIIEAALSMWERLSEEPTDLSAMSDHCHGEFSEALYVASLLSKMEGNLEIP